APLPEIPVPDAPMPSVQSQPLHVPFDYPCHQDNHINFSIRTLGPITVWVNCAGVSVNGLFLDVSEAEFKRVTEVNYFGSVNGVRVALQRMAPRKRGTIVQVLSTMSYRGIPLHSAYAGSKYALRGFIETVRSELVTSSTSIHVTMVHPPSINTPIFDHVLFCNSQPTSPIQPIYQPEVAADAIYFAATSHRREVFVSASSFGAALANKFAPGLLDVILGKARLKRYQSSKTPAPVPRESNLFEAGRLPSSTHGKFDHISRSKSWQLWASKNRAGLMTAVSIGLLGLMLLIRGAKRWLVETKMPSR
ncbi:SDR family NAD(P)-dependent oxidoreductase, partial [Komagataeibacter sp. NFXK3]